LPDHLAVCGRGVEGKPADEFVVLLRHGGDWWVGGVCGRGAGDEGPWWETVDGDMGLLNIKPLLLLAYQ
jgi:hypothetical protein